MSAIGFIAWPLLSHPAFFSGLFERCLPSSFTRHAKTRHLTSPPSLLATCLSCDTHSICLNVWSRMLAAADGDLKSFWLIKTAVFMHGCHMCPMGHDSVFGHAWNMCSVRHFYEFLSFFYVTWVVNFITICEWIDYWNYSTSQGNVYL